MSASLALAVADETGISSVKLDLIKQQIARGATDEELALFLYVAKRAGLDPLARQIYCIKRWDSTLNREVMTTQVSIDGLRLIADRTGRYAPGRATTFEERNSELYAATAYVMKHVQGTWMEVAATAYYSEYVQRKKDGQPTSMWATKPHIMLSKCAEALAIRRAFPAELSGIYTSDEMGDTGTPATAGNAPLVVDGATGEIVGGIVDSHAKPQPPTEAELRARWEKAVDEADTLGRALRNRDYPAHLDFGKQWKAVEMLEESNDKYFEEHRNAAPATTAV